MMIGQRIDGILKESLQLQHSLALLLLPMNVGVPIPAFGVILRPAHIKSDEEEGAEGKETSTESNCSHATNTYIRNSYM
eukprot:CAMPEP_0197716606 /NCGR_PEP_ID=MMETSP1434-20131217/1436_1 /TAXON_ID=265543 /ORGANISM="Minutocellus polymorphus, Strain CCMP3303" /LENGTH=78 /DNA_ID=CAMNT_0043300989 /DNA_START=424 /DNA_END=663 /DNA_ORIENTATION=-